jgi:hypothetical protein
MVFGMKRLARLATAILLFAGAAHAETVTVKYRGEVELSHFECQTIDHSSLVERVCYDAANSYMLISLKGTYYHYCGIDPDTVGQLLSAPSKGRFYNNSIKGRFDCRANPFPAYD